CQTLSSSMFSSRIQTKYGQVIPKLFIIHQALVHGSSLFLMAPLILFRTRFFGHAPWLGALSLEELQDFTLDQSRLREADAVGFHIPESSWSPFEDTPKFPGQLWVAWSKESNVNYPELRDPAFMRHFDLRMTYERDADIWAPYLPGYSTWTS